MSDPLAIEHKPTYPFPRIKQSLESQMIPNPDMGAFVRHLGVQITHWIDGEAILELTLKPEFLNRSGVIHGGILTTIIDTAGGYAGTFCTIPGHVRRAFTLSMTTQFTGQASSGVVRATARRRGGGRKIYFADVQVENEAGEQIAFGSATYRYRTGHEAIEGVPA